MTGKQLKSYAMGCMMGSIPERCNDGIFSLHHHIQAVAHPASYPVGTRSSYLGVKWLGHEADHSPLPSAKVKNEWRYISNLQYIVMVWCLIKQLSTGKTLPLLYLAINFTMKNTYLPQKQLHILFW